MVKKRKHGINSAKQLPDYAKLKSNKLANSGLTYDGYVSVDVASKPSKKNFTAHKRNKNHGGEMLKKLLTGSMIE